VVLDARRALEALEVKLGMVAGEELACVYILQYAKVSMINYINI
jgi:hypothetical protein